jgi:hypothetical protein
MTVPLDVVSNLQALFRLDFLFSGLEVSSAAIFGARLGVFALSCAGTLYLAARLALKALDCLKTLLEILPKLPGYLLVGILFVAPLSNESIGVRWMGYILVIVSLMMILGTAICVAVLWRYGVDQALRLLKGLRARGNGGPEAVRVSPGSMPGSVGL